MDRVKSNKLCTVFSVLNHTPFLPMQGSETIDFLVDCATSTCTKACCIQDQANQSCNDGWLRLKLALVVFFSGTTTLGSIATFPTERRVSDLGLSVLANELDRVHLFLDTLLGCGIIIGWTIVILRYEHQIVGPLLSERHVPSWAEAQHWLEWMDVLELLCLDRTTFARRAGQLETS